MDAIHDLHTKQNGNLLITGLFQLRPTDLPSGTPIRTLLESNGRQNFGFVAELENKDGRILWLTLFGGDQLHPTKIRSLPDGSLVLGGRALHRLDSDPSHPHSSEAVLLKLNPDGNRVEWIRRGLAHQTAVTGLETDSAGRIYWTAGTRFMGPFPMVSRLAPDGRFLPFAGDLSRHMDPRKEDVHILAPPENSSPPPRTESHSGQSLTFLGLYQSGGIQILPDGSFVVGCTLQYRTITAGTSPGMGTYAVVTRYSPAGRRLWSASLRRSASRKENTVSTLGPLLYNSTRDELLALVTERGGATPEESATHGTLPPPTSWIARLDPETGRALPETPLPSAAATEPLHLHDLAADIDGIIFIIGHNKGQTPVLLTLEPEQTNPPSSMRLTDSASGRLDITRIHAAPDGIWLAGSRSAPETEGGPANSASDAAWGRLILEHHGP